MSLVDEAVIHILNRRFVSCYFNVNGRIGGDRDAMRFARKLRGTLKYGAIATPDGKLVSSFFYGRLEVFFAMQLALLKHPELAQMTDAEKAILQDAEKSKNDPNQLLQAARLCGELMQFERAQKLIDTALEHASDQAARNRALYLKGHLRLINLNVKDDAAVRAAFGKMKDTQKDLQDDVAMDLLALNVEQRFKGFFGGWQFKKGTDLKATAALLQKQIDACPDSNRIGQMLFYQGLCYGYLGKLKKANRIWKTHVDDYPEDRWALLSRVHHTRYRFSPFSSRVGGTSKSKAAQLRDAAKLVGPLREHGVKVSVPELESGGSKQP